MKILLMTSSYPRHPEESINAGVFVRTMALSLRDQGHDVTVFTPFKSKQMVMDPGLRLHAFSWGGQETVLTRLSLKNPLHLLQLLSLWLCGTVSAVFWGRRQRFDRILAFWAIPSGWFGACLSRVADIPLDVWVLGSDIWKRHSYPFGGWIVRKTLQTATHVFADGEALRLESEHLSGRTVQLLRSMRELPDAAPISWSKGICRFLFVGRWDPVKGIDLFCDAFLRLRQEMPCEAHIFGQGPLEAWLRRRLAGAASVTVHGQASPDVIAAYMRACDFLVIPSRQESLPVVFSDAIQCGLPVIATAVGDLPAFLLESGAGLCVPPENTEALVQAMRTAAQQGKAAWVPACQALEKQFNPKQMVDQYLAAMGSVPQGDHA